MLEDKLKRLEQLYKSNRTRQRRRQVIATLSLLVICVVFWSLKLNGIGIAGEAFCGKDEHAHSEECGACTREEHVHREECGECIQEEHMHGEECSGCAQEEHIHTADCYSDITADLETSDDWEAPLADMSRGPTIQENVVLVARSQLGYTESTLNFQVDANEIRRGITRYGQWYGNPYGDWSAMFVSFCLEYAGATDLPRNAGPESMRLEWEQAGLYKAVSEQTPEIGNLVFLHKGDTEGADGVAIIAEIEDGAMTVIEGDVENAVTEARYDFEDAVIMGYGIVEEEALPVVEQEEAPESSDERAPAPNYTVWLDGTNGGLGYLTGSPNTAYTVRGGSVLQLPAEWTSPSKYSYRLRGWYDVTNRRYYPAGGEMEVSGNAVLYADWVAATYDIGHFNAQVADTVSTNSFVTTHMFDYNYLFNIHSANPQVTVDNRGHSESWSMVTSGNTAYGNKTLDFIFSDNDSVGQLNMPDNRSGRNMYHEATTVTSGIYSAALGEMLFDTGNAFDPATGTGVLGKTYLGTGDHLFQIMNDIEDEHYGYYYYDSKHNAASYNRSNRRFYVYDYLSATSDSIGGAYSDFLPMNSPYTNINGKTVGTYNYDGVDGEYRGVPHYRYDSKYNSGDYNSANNVSTDYAYGMRLDINFYLTQDPGQGGNKDIHGKDIKFQFSGDDDLWVLVDGVLALDIGGIHQSVAGEINFSTGVVTVNGGQTTSLMNLGIKAGAHKLTVLYLERGASMSNCSIYFNLVPRFGLELQKEDVLTQELLDGTQFTIYEDFECTKPAELWESESAYHQDLTDGVADQSRSSFTVIDGRAKIWGLGSGNTYYIKETAPPSADGYGIAKGVIRMRVEKIGLDTYEIDVIADAQGNAPSNGFTVHSANIDEETRRIYIAVTNAPETVTETTTVQVSKKWKDTANHSRDRIDVYLTVTDPDGTVRRIREVTLSDENDWSYIWTNLPEYDYDNLTKVQYGVEESYKSGYYSTVRRITQIEIPKTQWAEALSFKNGETYILRTTYGYLSTLDDKADTGYKWVDEATAKTSPYALWTTTVNGSTVKFTNGIGQTITFYYNGGSPTDFFATSDPPNQQSEQGFSYSNRAGGLQLFYRQGNTSYYLTGSMNSSQKFGYSTNANSSMIINPVCRITQTDIRDVEDWAYEITNTPLGANNETSFAVRKNWVIPEGEDGKLYQEFTVTVRLFANGVNTGRSIMLNLKNNWQGVFQGLPYKDESGNIIRYTVDEVWDKPKWVTSYGEIQVSGGNPPSYSVVITNTYHPGGPELPSTGSPARLLYVLCGAGIMLASLVYGIVSRRKRERRMK